jgi:hypothetical protein
MERAADNMDKLELKRAKSFGREKKVKERAKGWEEVNEVKRRKAKREKEELDEVERRKGLEWVSDEEMDVGEGVEGKVPEVPGGVLASLPGEVTQLEVMVPESVPLPVATEVDEF